MLALPFFTDSLHQSFRVLPWKITKHASDVYRIRSESDPFVSTQTTQKGWWVFPFSLPLIPLFCSLPNFLANVKWHSYIQKSTQRFRSPPSPRPHRTKHGPAGDLRADYNKQ